MTFSTAEIKEDILEKTIRVGRSPVTREMCRKAAEKNPIAFMQRRIKKIFTDPSGKKKPMVFINRPRITKTFKEKEKAL